jgi:hypothetical protein
MGLPGAGVRSYAALERSQKLPTKPHPFSHVQKTSRGASAKSGSGAGLSDFWKDWVRFVGVPKARVPPDIVARPSRPATATMLKRSPLRVMTTSEPLMGIVSFPGCVEWYASVSRAPDRGAMPRLHEHRAGRVAENAQPVRDSFADLDLRVLARHREASRKRDGRARGERGGVRTRRRSEARGRDEESEDGRCR